MRPRGEMLRIREPPARGFQRRVFLGEIEPQTGRGRDRQITRRDDLFGLFVVAAIEQVCRRNDAGPFVGQRDVIARRPFGQLRLDLRVLRLDLVRGRLVVLIEVSRIDQQLGVGGDERLLLVRSFVGRCPCGGPQFFPLVFRELAQLDDERGFDRRINLRLQGSPHRRRLGLNRFRLGPVGIGHQRQVPFGRPSPVRDIECRFKHRPQPEVVDLRNRVVPVVVTLRTAHGQAQHRRANHLEGIGHHLVARFGLVDAARGRRIGHHPQEPRRDQFVELFGRQFLPRTWYQFIPGQLLDDKLIQRLVGIERPDDVVPKLVGELPLGIVVAVPFGIGIAHDIEPVPGPSLAIAG